MSSLKNAIPRKAHKERAQPQARKKFGLLEKHKDYVARAKAFHKKEETLRRLKEKAASRNPDEFYFGMIKSKTVDGVHRPQSEANKYTQEELLLMKTQDIGYILQKAQSEKKKIEKLTATLHSLDGQPSSKHVYFAEDREEAKEIRSHSLATYPQNFPAFQILVMAPTKAVVADDHLALPAGGKNTPQTNTIPISNIQTDIYGLEIWEGTLPIIDLGGLHGPRRSDTIKQLGHACQHYGGFMLKNHGISERLLNDIMSKAREFFHLPEEERMKLYSPDPTSLIRLATGFKDDNQNVFVSRESLKFHCHPIENYVNLWPTNPPSYREVVSEYCVAAKRAEITLLEAVFEGLGMERKSIDQILDNHGQYASLNYYPTCEKSNLGLTFGLRGHTDPTILTMLLPDEVPGLEILQNGDWVPVKPIPNTLIVHVGDVLQGLSNCRYKSLLHRVIVNSEKERLSIASYCYPSNDTQMGPPKELIDDDHPLIYKDYTYEEFYTTMWKQRLPDATRLDAFKVSAA